MPINTTTKKNEYGEEKTEKEKTNLFTSLQRKPEKKENEKFVDKIIEFINKKEPGWWTYHLPDEHTSYTDKMLIIGVGMSIFGLWSGVGALSAGMTGSPIVAEVLGFTALFSAVVGFSLVATAILIDGIADLRE